MGSAVYFDDVRDVSVTSTKVMSSQGADGALGFEFVKGSVTISETNFTGNDGAVAALGTGSIVLNDNDFDGNSVVGLAGKNGDEF